MVGRPNTMETEQQANVLVLAPHMDDGEMGCGGTIARFVEEGRKVHYVAQKLLRRRLLPKFWMMKWPRLGYN